MWTQETRMAILVAVTVTMSVSLLIVEIEMKKNEIGYIERAFAMIPNFIAYCIVHILALINLEHSPRLNLYLGIFKACFVTNSFVFTICITLILDDLDIEGKCPALRCNLIVFSFICGTIIAVCIIGIRYFRGLSIGMGLFLTALLLQFAVRIVKSTRESSRVAMLFYPVTTIVGIGIASAPHYMAHRRQQRDEERRRE